MAPKTEVDYDHMYSLSSVLSGRATDLQGISDGISKQKKLANKEISAGQEFIQKVWSKAVHILSADEQLTSTKVDKSVMVYSKGDKTVGKQIAETNPDNPHGPH
ncbi:MAG TPA: hypothetical protein VHC49_04065 [Mycobacteriales bacterium]|nr:hypothetical protein [Mycobacteriales bacterium]